MRPPPRPPSSTTTAIIEENDNNNASSEKNPRVHRYLIQVANWHWVQLTTLKILTDELRLLLKCALYYLKLYARFSI